MSLVQILNIGCPVDILAEELWKQLLIQQSLEHIPINIYLNKRGETKVKQILEDEGISLVRDKETYYLIYDGGELMIKIRNYKSRGRKNFG